jgi:hypothetical protein
MLDWWCRLRDESNGVSFVYFCDQKFMMMMNMMNAWRTLTFPISRCVRSCWVHFAWFSLFLSHATNRSTPPHLLKRSASDSARWIWIRTRFESRLQHSIFCFWHFLTIYDPCSYTLVPFIFIFSPHLKIHNSQNINPFEMRFIVPWSLPCLLFYGDFCKNCARLYFKIA